MKINFSFKQFLAPNLKVKLPIMLSAIFMMGVSLSVLVEIGWGTDPATFVNLHFASILGWNDVGTVQIIHYSILLVFTLLFGAHHIGFGSLANMFLIGYVVDFSRWVWNKIGFHEYIMGMIENNALQGLIPLFVVSLIVFVIAAAVYMNSKLGNAPYDALPVIISDAIPKVPFFIVRMLFDFSAIALGLLLAYFAQDKIIPVAEFFSLKLRTSILGSFCMSLMLGPVISVTGKLMRKLIPAFQDTESAQ